MMKSAKRIAGALALALGVAAAVSAADWLPNRDYAFDNGEEAIAAAKAEIKAAQKAAKAELKSVKKAVAKKLQQLKKATENSTYRGLYGRDYCNEGETLVRGEEGSYCRGKGYSVTCEVIGHGPVSGEDGYAPAIVGKCDPEGGFAGPGLPQGPQAP